jgi:3-carboxy-cis,cis-muconate cycloisomerase
VLAGMPEVSSRLDRNAIDRLTDPRNYLGVVPQMIDGMLHGRE